MRRHPALFAAVAGLCVVAGAVIVVRLASVVTHGSRSLPFNVAMGVLHATMIIGMGFLAHHFYTKLVAVGTPIREHIAATAALGSTRYQKFKAGRQIAAIERQGEAWDYWAARMQGRYDRFWTRACAEFGTTPPPPTPPTDTAPPAPPLGGTPTQDTPSPTS